jgi:hypothetical protein
VFHIDRAATNMKRRRCEALNTQQLKTDCRANDVDNRIERAHLVKVDVFNWFVVHAGFSFRQSREYFRRAILHRVRQSGVVNDLENIGKVTMRMFVLSLHTSVGCADAGTIDRLKINCVALHVEQSELLLESIRLDAGGDQGAQDHVTTGAGEAVEIKSLHSEKSVNRKFKFEVQQSGSCQWVSARRAGR